MRILLIMDPGIPVPPPAYGGHERLVYMFAEEYAKLGHEVSLLAGPDSAISGKTYAFGQNNLQRSKRQKLKELLFVWKFLYQRKKDFDLIHNFGRLAYLLPILQSPVKKIMTYGRPVAQQGIKKVTSLPNQNLIFTACSNYCVNTGNVAGRWETVYNAIDFSKYQLQEATATDAPLMFLGRLDQIKGLHTAIAVAKATNNTLWIGGNIPDTADNYQYYKETLEPQFDNKQIIYLGALNDEQKNHYLGRSKALLFPIEWDEPFGMVMVEAMACGTPVIAFKRGSVPEVIQENTTGFIVHTKEEMIDAVGKLDQITRKACRTAAQQRFDSPVIAKEYLHLHDQENN
ncbi:glycosyltransferase family 4 protein [Pedobacter sp. KR3-3]|uniref:Glycosyltransferase family 4 protein n=1 Tax=Pedobacter albus TaxID=3113905 RepID=A0ABU7I6P3_9SPHI|nr:glycosyltransferase family 4 protein [Pedobacter sp. KR3-3]MEE1945147.1 glycosyltransferase family 4 protein [Pedobacter sp. KR3-3]